MRINELKRIAEENDYELTECLEQYELIRRNGLLTQRIIIGKARANGLWTYIKDWCDDKDVKMIKAAVEFNQTPAEDRKEEKKYIYKHKFIKTKGGNPTYLGIRQRPSISYPVLQGSNEDVFEYKVQFTDKEIERFKKEYGICLDDFEKNEVEE